MPRLLSISLLFFCPLLVTAFGKAAILPPMVLVLYNKDWPVDAAPFAALGRPEEVCGLAWTTESLAPYGNKYKSPITLDRAVCP